MTETSHPAPLVEVAHLHKHYGKTHAVRGLSFQVHRGEIVGFLGPNGAGKSTTMKMITGFLRPSSGKAAIAGIDMNLDPLQARKHLGYLPENAPLYQDMMVIDFLRFIAQMRQLDWHNLRQRVRSICERCGLMDVLGKDIGQLSKGYRQRVGLAQALLHDPDLLVLDEPTSGLDPNQIVEIRALIREVGKDKTVLLSTHILPEVQATCNRVLIINEGTLVADNVPENLQSSLPEQGAMIHLVLRQAQKTADLAALSALLQRVPGVSKVVSVPTEGPQTVAFSLRSKHGEDPREAIFHTAVQEKLVILDLHREQQSLEDSFRRLTKEQSNT